MQYNLTRAWNKWLKIIAKYMTAKVKKVKQSHYRPWQALRVRGSWGSQNLRQSAHGGKVVSPTHRPPLTVLISVRGWVDPRAIVRPEGLCQWKIPMTPTGIDPATFRFVAQWMAKVHFVRIWQRLQTTQTQQTDIHILLYTVSTL
jgi:hypothetical protein